MTSAFDLKNRQMALNRLCAERDNLRETLRTLLGAWTEACKLDGALAADHKPLNKAMRGARTILERRI